MSHQIVEISASQLPARNSNYTPLNFIASDGANFHRVTGQAMEDWIRTIVSNFTGGEIGTRVSNNTQAIQQLTNKHNQLEQKVTTAIGDIVGLKQRMSAAEGVNSQQATQIGGLTSQLGQLQNEYNTTKNTVSTHDTAITSHGQRIGALEQGQSTLSQRIETEKGRVSANASEIASIKNTVQALRDLPNEISSIKSTLTSHDQRITAAHNRADQAHTALAQTNQLANQNKGRLDQLNPIPGKVSTLEQRATQFEQNVTRLDQRIDNANQGLSGKVDINNGESIAQKLFGLPSKVSYITPYAHNWNNTAHVEFRFYADGSNYPDATITAVKNGHAANKGNVVIHSNALYITGVVTAKSPVHLHIAGAKTNVGTDSERTYMRMFYTGTDQTVWKGAYIHDYERGGLRLIVDSLRGWTMCDDGRFFINDQLVDYRPSLMKTPPTVTDANNAIETGWYQFNESTLNKPNITNSYNWIWCNTIAHSHDSRWAIQIAYPFSLNFQNDCPDMVYRTRKEYVWSPWVSEVKRDIVRAFDRVICGYDSGVRGSLNCTNWIYITGNHGVYFASYGGGLHMTDGSTVRVSHGKAMAATDFSLTSDARKKKDIKDLVDTKPLRPRRFKWIEGNDEEFFGFIAQEVEALHPEAISVDPSNGIKHLKTMSIVAILSDQLNQQADLIKKLEARIADLESR